MTRKVAALKHLKRVDQHFYAHTLRHHTSLPLQLCAKRTHAQLFESLVSTIISQQLGLAAADAIFARVKKVCGGTLTVKVVLKVRPVALRAAGLSGAKIKTLKELAKAIEHNSLDLLLLKKISEAEAAEQLMQIWGIGPWTVEMFLMFALGRPDVFSPGDLGLVRAMEAIYDLPKNVPRGTLLAIAEKWSPHRTYASLLLWRTRDTKN
ncbi:MAG: DNA-3-methyladenine glycosylase [Candidatus Parcubacteria bacterium]|nr:DNA-3-methyladenine glycosylase [Candidatus Parcubacteria bacterium]